MHLQSEAIVLKTFTSGEHGAVACVFSQQHGKLKGYVPVGRKKRAHYQPGNILQITHQRRLNHQLGTLSGEVLHTPAVFCFHSLVHLQALTYVVDVLDKAFEEHDAHPGLYTFTHAFLLTITEPGLWQRLAFFEVELLQRLGYGLSLHPDDAVPCPQNSPLTYVSPNSGRAVPQLVGAPYAAKLLRLPHLFGGKMPENGSKSTDFLDVFKLTGHFLTIGLGNVPASRQQLMALGAHSGFAE